MGENRGLWIISAPLCKDPSLEGGLQPETGMLRGSVGDPVFLLSHNYSKSNWLTGGLHEASGEGSALPHALLGASKPQLWTQVSQEHPGGRCRMEQK